MALRRAIQAIGPAGLPELLAALKSDDVQTRANAATALSELGPRAEAAVPALAAAVQGDPDDGVRASAASALGAVGPAAKSALPALRKAAGDRNAALTHDAADSKLRVRAQMAIEQIQGTR
jgi:HEAT repeat protein